MVFPVQADPLDRTHVSEYVCPAGRPPEVATTLPSVNVVVTVPETGPVAVTEYSAMNVFGSWNWYVKLPSKPAYTSASWLHVWPALSSTRRCTGSDGCQPVPLSVTVSPGR